jgi:hypothetical protein
MAQQLRDILSEIRNTIRLEWSLLSRFGTPAPDPNSDTPDSDLRRLILEFRDIETETERTQEYLNIQKDTRYGFVESDFYKNQPFEFFEPRPISELPESRIPLPGITPLPARFHSERVVTSDSDMPETGFTMHPMLMYLITTKYPEYLSAATHYCRPLGTTDATFADFNKEQVETPPVPTSLLEIIIPMVTFFLNALPFLPLHYVDTLFCKMPLSTGTSYFYRHNYDIRTHAAFAHNKSYSDKQTSKGYFFNSFTIYARRIIHNIKLYQHPFPTANLSPTQIKDKLRTFFMEHATMLFTRNHISDRDGNLKQRPVYAMDTLFLHIECMLTFPLHVMARSMKSSVMYSIETIRGGCSYMDSIASGYQSFLCIDWSSYDQRMPFTIVDTFFTWFLPSLLVINHAYQPTFEYPTYPDLDEHKMFTRIFSLLCFLRTWYFNCVFCTADGFAYVRQFAGVASGMLNTQYLDSYCNLFILFHALLHFGCSSAEIFDIAFFVMGDDNVLLTHWSIERLTEFLSFLESHSLSRFNMVLSPTKSIITSLRSKIEMLGYCCNCAFPKRPLPKLVAQLCYPEHGPVDRYMSSRAVGIAYASAGYDETVYTMCKDVYHLFLPFTDEKSADLSKVIKHLPGIFKMLDDPSEFIQIDRFPSIDEIRVRYSTWKGELDIKKKWDIAHFATLPGIVPPDSKTMKDYMSENDIVFPDVDRLF